MQKNKKYYQKKHKLYSVNTHNLENFSDKIKKEIHQSGKEYRNSFKGLEEEVHSLEKRINSYIKELSSLDDKKEKAILTTIANLEDELERFTLLQKRINGQVKKKLGLRQIDFNDPQS